MPAGADERKRPGDSTSLSYDSVVTLPVFTSRKSTAFFWDHRDGLAVRAASIANMARNICSVPPGGSIPFQ